MTIVGFFWIGGGGSGLYDCFWNNFNRRERGSDNILGGDGTWISFVVSDDYFGGGRSIFWNHFKSSYSSGNWSFGDGGIWNDFNNSWSGGNNNFSGGIWNDSFFVNSILCLP